MSEPMKRPPQAIPEKEFWRVEWKLKSKNGWEVLFETTDREHAVRVARERKTDEDEYRLSHVVTTSYPEGLEVKS